MIDAILQHVELFTVEQYVILSLLPFIIGIHWANVISNRKEKKIFKQAPKLSISSFQIAPLGRDAVFTIKNDGSDAIISQLKITDRTDLLIKNEFGGHKIIQGKEYRIFLESAGKEKLDDNFCLHLVFMDMQGNTFQQNIKVRERRYTPLEIIKRA